MRTAEANITSSAAEPTASHFISERTLKLIAIVVALMLIAYLAGFVPGWLSTNKLEVENSRLQRLNSAYRLTADLATASLHAERGQFDKAIASAGSFFEKLDKEIGAADGILNNEAAVNMLSRRDEIVSMLARSDPNASAVLGGWYFELEALKDGGK